MSRESLVIITLAFVADCWLLGAGQSGICATVQADDTNSTATRITATEPAALVCGSKVIFKVRGFDFKEATDLRFPTAAQINVEFKETKDAGQPKGLDNKLVGNTQLAAEVTLPADLPTGLLEYVVIMPAGEVAGKIRVLSAESVIDEKEPNNGFREAQELRPGQVARGNIQSDKDVDVYAFPTQAGQRLRISVTSGGPLLMDALLHCYDSRGQFLAAADDDQSRDPVLILTAQADGRMFLCVSSAHDVGGEWHSYYLTVEETK